jgi:hypothetical protein
VSALTSQPPPHLGQTLITRDGDELIGRLEITSIKLATSDGTAASIPLAQISRLKQTLAPGPTQPSAPSPAAILYGLRGDYLAVDPPAEIEFQSRWGLLKLRLEQVRQIVFSAKEQAAHQIFLSDGSTLTGMMTADALSLKPRNLPGSALTAPVGEMAKLVLIPTTPPLSGGKLTLWGGDILRGSLSGTLTLQTAYQSVTLNGNEIERITTAPDSPTDLTITLNGKPPVQGAPGDASVTCQLNCGLSLSIPAATIVGYSKSGN